VQTSLAKLGTLTFEEPDTDRFPSLGLARRAGDQGGTLPAVFNAANEVAVDQFVAGKLSFPGISVMVGKTMSRHRLEKHPSLDQILEADAWARKEALTP